VLIGDILTNNTRHFPDKVGLIDGETAHRYTWSEIDRRVNRLANSIAGIGICKGNRVGIISENSLQCAEFYFAVARLGAIGCGFNYRLSPNQIAVHIRETQPKAIFFQGRLEALIRAATENAIDCKRLLRVDDDGGSSDYERMISDAPSDQPIVALEPDDPLMITFSSGTSGLPKGIISTHLNRLTCCLEVNQFCDRYHWDDVVLNSTPFCIGVSGQAQLGAIAFSGAATVMHVLKGDTWAEVIERERVSVLLTTKSRLMPVWEHLAHCQKPPDLSSLRRVTTGGQPHTPTELRRIIEFCGVTTTSKMYGLSETSTVGTRLLSHEVAAGLAPDATDQQLEIQIKGDCVTPGYWNAPELYDQAFRDGWFRTNDLGAFDEDGYLYIKGRMDFAINTGGLLVAPAEIEARLLDHPAVADAGVIGVPDDKWGEVVTAIVHLKPNSPVDEEELQQHCRKALAGFQVPKKIHFVDGLPKDVQGRIDVRELRKRYAMEPNNQNTFGAKETKL
jgi:acyl-CoA synthetase (AMP-forming)/AMP-acid ligase II